MFFEKVWNTIKEIAQTVGDFIVANGWDFVLLLVVAVVGIFAVKLIVRFVRKALVKSKMSSTWVSFVMRVVKLCLYLVLVLILLQMMGVSIAPLVAAVSAAGLAAALALQDGLSNLANGVIILSTRPFEVGDTVEVNGVSASVKGIHMLTTELLTFDNRKVTMPNSSLVNNTIINVSSAQTRRVDFVVKVAPSVDIDKLRELLMKIAADDARVLSDPAPTVKLNERNIESFDFNFRVWCNNDKYWDVYWDMNEEIAKKLRGENIEMPSSLNVSVKEVTK